MTVTPDGAPIEDYAIAVPSTAQPTAAPPADDDPGHLLPDEVWARVVADAEAGRS